MDNGTKVALAAAVAGGYVLGRTKKGKLALTVATYLAGRRFGLEPRQLAAEAMKRLGQIPQVAQLQEQVKGDVLGAGRKAVSAVADRGMSSLADTLQSRTGTLGDLAHSGQDDKAQDSEPEKESRPRGGSRRPASKEKATARKPARQAKKSAPAEKSSPPKKRATAKKSAPAKKAAAKKSTPAKKAAPAKAAARKSARAKKTSSRTDRRR